MKCRLCFGSAWQAARAQILLANAFSKSSLLGIGWPATSSGPDPLRNLFATDLPATLFLACFLCTFLHLVSCSNSLVNNSKHA